VRTAAFLALFPAAAAAAPEKFALAVYHFNIQYCAGGLIGFPDGETHDPFFELDEKQVEDLIVTESLDPLLDMYLRHPAWGADIELQGYMLDVMRERHAGVLDKLRTLAARGQIAVDSLHWSDQLWVAYPRRDLEVSFEMTQASFAAAQIGQGLAIFSQEGQFGPGLARFMAERGLKAMVVPRNLFKWHYATAIAPLYRFGDLHAVVTDGAADERVQVQWSFVNDGELAMTGNRNPYLGTRFKRDEQAMAEFEAAREAEEAAGWKLVTVEKYVARALELGVPAPDLPPMLDGAWQPNSTSNVQLWMGGAGLWDPAGAEADNLVLTANARVRKKVVLAERAAEALKDEWRARARDAWRELLFAEVSDSTGWNPWVLEREYSLEHAAAAEAHAGAVLAHPEIKPRLAPARIAPTLVDDAGPFTVEVLADTARAPAVTWKKRGGEEIWELEIAFGASDPGSRDVQVSFPRSHDRAVWSPALEDSTVADVDLTTLVAETPTLPLANGLVGLADDTFLILRTDSVHVAAILPRAERFVRFLDQTAPATPFTWRFVLLRGSAQQALDEARALNVEPDLILRAGVSCGCGSASGAVPGALALFCALLPRRRRRSNLP
jgi:hypothetical protein